VRRPNPGSEHFIQAKPEKPQNGAPSTNLAKAAHHRAAARRSDIGASRFIPAKSERPGTERPPHPIAVPGGGPAMRGGLTAAISRWVFT